jgi:hypothetical protein
MVPFEHLPSGMPTQALLQDVAQASPHGPPQSSMRAQQEMMLEPQQCYEPPMAPKRISENVPPSQIPQHPGSVTHDQQGFFPPPEAAFQQATAGQQLAPGYCEQVQEPEPEPGLGNVCMCGPGCTCIGCNEHPMNPGALRHLAELAEFLWQGEDSQQEDLQQVNSQQMNSQQVNSQPMNSQPSGPYLPDMNDNPTPSLSPPLSPPPPPPRDLTKMGMVCQGQSTFVYYTPGCDYSEDQGLQAASPPNNFNYDYEFLTIEDPNAGGDVSMTIEKNAEGDVPMHGEQNTGRYAF